MNFEIRKQLLSIILISAIFIVLIFLYIKIHFSIKYENRLKNYALENESNKVSLADEIIKIIKTLATNLSKLLKKSAYLTKYSKRINKYFIYYDFEVMQFISFSFLFMFLIDILFIFSMFIKFFAFHFYPFILVNIISFYLPLIVLIIFYKRKKRLIEEQLLQAVSIMNGSFKSGKNILNSVNMVHQSLPSPIKEEFETIQKDLEYGLSVEEAFKRFSQRVNIEEAKYITSSLSLLSKTGGNIVNVFNMIEKNFYDRLKIKNELSALTSTSKFLYRFLLFLPILFVIVIIMLNPEYFNPLLSTTIGYVIDFIILVLYIIYIILIKRVMKVEEV